MKKQQEVLRLLEQGDNLPALPRLFYEVVEAASNPETPVSDLSNLILQDQVLTGKVLKIANSAYYSASERISTVTRAVMVLGFISLRNSLTAIMVVDTLNSEAFKASLFKPFWVHALACSLVGRFLAERLEMDHPEEAMIAGLIHDCGKLFLDHHFPEAYRRVTREMEQGKDVLKAERELFGLTHVDLGERIAKKWALPSALVEAIGNHHVILNSSRPPRLSDIVYVADRFSALAIPQEWAEKTKWILSEKPTERRVQNICVELRISEEAIEEIIQQTRKNIRRTASDLGLKFLEPSIQGDLHPSSERFRRQREREKRQRLQAMIDEIKTMIKGNPRPEELLQLAIEAIHYGIGFNRTLLFLVNPSENTIDGKAGLGNGVPSFLKSIRVPIESDGLIGRVIRDKRAFNLFDRESSPYGDLPPIEISLPETKTLAFVPLIVGTKAMGLVMVDNAVTQESIGDPEIDSIKVFLALVGDHIAQHMNGELRFHAQRA
jgi:HD-like signal output (HDOD) protein